MAANGATSSALAFRSYMPMEVLLRDSIHDFEPILQQFDSFDAATEAPERAAILLGVRTPSSAAGRGEWTVDFKVGERTFVTLAGGVAAAVTHALGMHPTESARLFVQLHGAEVNLDDLFSSRAPAPFHSPGCRGLANANAGSRAQSPELHDPHHTANTANAANTAITAITAPSSTYGVPSNQFGLLPRNYPQSAPRDYALDQQRTSEALRRVVVALEEERRRWAERMEHMLEAVGESTLALRQARALTAGAADRRMATRLFDHALSGRSAGWFCGDASDWRLATELAGAVPKVVEVYMGQHSTHSTAAGQAPGPTPPPHAAPPELRSTTAHRGAVRCEWAAQLQHDGTQWHHPGAIAAKARGDAAMLWLVALGEGGRDVASVTPPRPGLRVHFF